MSRTHENGTVTRLFRWPVKSMAGEPVDALRVDARGAGGDRTHALWDTSRDRLLTARQAPGMLRWRAAYPGVAGDALDPVDPPEPLVTAPGGTVFAWSDPALFAALSDDLGFPVVGRRDVDGQQDLACSLLLTSATSLAALSAELAGGELDVRRFRPNLHVTFNDLAPYAETAFTGGAARTRMKLLVDAATDRVEAVHMVGPDAPEIVQCLAVAMTAGATKAHFDRTLAMHPTAAEEFVTMHLPVAS